MTTKRKSSFRGKVGTDAQRQQKAATSYGHLLLPKGASVFTPEPGGKVKLDFLPYEVTDSKHPDRNAEKEIAIPGSLWYKRPYKLHRNVGASNDSAVCLTSIGKKCPICELRAKRVKEGAEKEELDAMKASQRNLYVVIPLDSKKDKATPHIFDISQFLFQNLLNEELEENNENEVFPDIEEGLTLKIRFDSKTIGTSKPFAEASRIDFLEREETYTTAILEDIPNLDEVLKILSYKELEDKFLELDQEEDGGKLKDVEEEDELPKRVKKTAKPIVEEEDEPEEERPVRRISKKVVEEDEDEKPVRTVNRGTTAKEGTVKCPLKHKFGADFEKFDECEDCAEWDGCYDENKKK